MRSEAGPGAAEGTREAALSLAQRRSWLLQRLNPEDRSLNVVLVFAIEGPLREDLLREALETLVGRHESLRTTFGGGGDDPVVCITSEAACPCPARDLSGLDPSELPVALARVEGEEFGHPFDLEKGPPVRACLVRLGPRHHRLIVVWHETAADAWSRRVVARELPLIYEALVQDRYSAAGIASEAGVAPAGIASTAEVPVSGRTRPSHWEAVARGQRWLLSPAAGEQLSYWRDQLADLPAETDLPTDRPRAPLQGVRGGIVAATLSPELGGSIADLASLTGAAPEVVILAAFLAVLHRYTGAEDLAVGTVVSGRRPEEADLIGPFENTLVLRSRPTGRTTFADLVGATDRVVRGAREHADLPFERLVDVLKPARDLSRTPFFQIMFAAWDGPISPGIRGVGADGGEAAGGPPGADGGPPGRTGWLPLLVHPGTAKHDLTLTLRRAQGPNSPPADGWTIELEYGLDIFDRETVARMVEHFQTLLADATLHPQRPLADLKLLTADESRKLLVEWNDTATDFPRDLCVHELYGAQVARTPEAVAVEFEDESLTYRELDQRGNRLANRLRRLGVGPETLVGLAVERSLEMVVGLLGILKAGGAYVPLDPAYPGPRLGFMIEEIGTPVILTQARFADALPAGSARLVSLDADWSDIATESDVAPAGGVGPDDLIYVMYTSGSTGRPKGVAVTHQGVVRLVKETGYARFGPDETFLQLSNMAFDVATFEIWGCLLHGGRLVIFPAHTPTLSELGQVLRERGVTTLWLTAGLFHLMVDENLAGLRGVRQLLAGGDVLSAPHVRRVLAERGDGTLIDGYGPTEATTFASCHPMTKDSIVGASVPIGRPIANTTLYVLDGYGNPTPIGVPGELCIGGVGLARGYWKRPDLTAETFVPDPFGSGPGARLYRTGDLACFLPDGNIEFLGRLDNQVKVRGFRVELGEIEAVLGQHPALQTAAVVAWDGGGDDGRGVDGRGGLAGDKRLLAYVVPITGRGVSPAELRDYLRNRLPDYMTPADFVVLDRLPLSPSGKVDRRNLPRPSLAGPEAVGRGHGWTPFEDVLGAIWTQVLGRAPAATDSFFEAGGNSLLATRLVSRVRSLLGVELPLQAVFETPTLAGLAGVIENARRAGAGPGPGLPPLVAVDRGHDLPLSFAQRRLWFWDRYEPGSPLYNLPFVFRLEGLLDPEVLGRVLTEIVDRHEVLRTTFRDTPNGPVQVIAPGRGGVGEGLPLPVVDLSSLPPDARIVRLDALILEEALRTFDLGRGPLVRATLVGLGPEGHILLLSLHHIVFDGWSLGVLSDELAALYEAFSSGRPSPLPELRLQYADFAVWQRKWLSGEVLERGLAYWRRQLADLPVPDLPTDRPRPRVQSFRGRTHRFTLPRDLTEELRDLGSRHGATLFMTLLAGFQTLLHRLSGQHDIAVGSPIANRTLGGVEGLIGFFVNTLVLRTDLSGQPTFAELIGRVRQTTVGAYVHQDLPFEQLVEEVRPARDPGRSPLFQVMFALQNAPAGTVEPPVLKVSVRETPTGTAKFDLTLQLWETGSGLDGELEYATDLYEEATAGRLVGHFETLLRGAVADPGRRLDDLPLLTPEQRRRALVEWNATETAYPREATVHQLFAERAGATPEAVAVESGSGNLTYRELDWRSDRLAAYLRRLGVGPETLVGVAVERSPEMVVGLLGVLKSGGAYVPLDPTYPRDRLAFMVADTRAPVILTLDHLAASLPETGATIIRLDSDWPLIAGTNPEEPAAGPVEATGPAVSPDGLAYVIYTSGSTGRPKGVAVTHRNIVRLVKETNYARFGPEEVFLHLAPLAFDASTFEIWGPLLGGGRLVVFPPERPSLEELGRALTRHKVTTLFLTTALFNLLVDERLEDLGKVSQLLAGGEVMSVTHVRRVADGRPGCVMSAVYGPTEATTFASHCPMGGRGEATSVPIGRPIANTTLYVLDRNLTPVPEGVAGEIYVGGDGVARGYYNRPVPTAEKFVPDPFAARPGARLYRTGDLGRYLPGGDVDFLGRVDNQVKIRGFRIEPEEVETVLGQHPAVREAVVLVREDPLGERRLVAHVASGGATPTFITELRSFLREHLPDYMVPAAIVVLERFPLGPSGKVDRGALPAPELGEPVEGGSFLAPTGPVEEGLARIWGELLGLESISAAADFFELGGHSLLATRAVSRVRETFGVELSLRTLFEAPTLSGLAARIAAALPTPVTPAPVTPASVTPASLAPGPPIVARDRRGPSPLSYAQQRLWFLDQLAPGGPLYNVPVAMRLEGRLEARVLEQSLAEIVRRHETLRTTFAEKDGSPVQIISPDAGCTLTSVDLSDQPRTSRERALAELASTEARRPFALDEGPLLRVTLVELDREEQALLLMVHHIAADGWALEILFGELAALYEAFGAGRPSPLPGLRVQYADFALWQREWVQAGALRDQLAYWRWQLGLPLPTLDLPFARPRPAAVAYRGRKTSRLLGREVVDDLRTLGRREGLTLFMILLAAFVTLLYRVTGQKDIVVGTSVANRTRLEVEGLIGCFVNTLPLRTDLSGNPTFRELLDRVREVTLAAFTHQDVPFDLLVDTLQLPRDPSRPPLVAVLFDLHESPLCPAVLGRARVTPLEVDAGVSKFDFNLEATAGPGGLDLALYYRRDLYEPRAMEGFLDQYHHLLTAVAADAGRRLEALPLGTEQDQLSPDTLDELFAEERGT